MSANEPERGASRGGSMLTVQYREADQSHVPGMARIRAAEGDGAVEESLRDRYARYLARERHPQQALMPRVIYVALEGEALVGYIAGHLTRRYSCDGEL